MDYTINRPFGEGTGRSGLGTGDARYGTAVAGIPSAPPKIAPTGAMNSSWEAAAS